MENQGLEDRINTATKVLSILVIDDNKGIVDVLEKMLGKIYSKIHSECKIDTGANWGELISLALKKQRANERYDMVITNQMPVTDRVNGVKTLREIQKEIPIILTSSIPSEELIAYSNSIKRYNITFLPKAFSFESLETVVRKYLN